MISKHFRAAGPALFGALLLGASGLAGCATEPGYEEERGFDRGYYEEDFGEPQGEADFGAETMGEVEPRGKR